MAYGLLSFNLNGVSIIDETSLQVKILKEGSCHPGRVSTDGTTSSTGEAHLVSNTTGALAKIVPLPNRKDECLVFAKPDEAPASTADDLLTFGMLYANVLPTMQAYQAASVGQNYVLVKEAPSAIEGICDWSLYPWVPSEHTYTVQDFLGSDLLNGYANPPGSSSHTVWGGLSDGATVTAVTKITGGGPTLWKVFLSENLSTAVSANQNLDFEIDAIMFVRPEHNPFPTGIDLDYKIGTRNDEQQTSGYGLDMFTSTGELGYSSDRITYQGEVPFTSAFTMETYVTGIENFETVGTLGPIEAQIPANEFSYYAFMTGIADPCAHIAGGAASGTSNRTERGFRGWATMYQFSYSNWPTTNWEMGDEGFGMFNKSINSSTRTPKQILDKRSTTTFAAACAPGRLATQVKSGFSTPLQDYASDLLRTGGRLAMIGTFL